MAIKKTARKSSHKATINYSQIDENTEKKISKNSKKVINKAKKRKPITFVLIAVFFIIGICGGYAIFAITSKNDCFELIGEERVVLTLEEKYVNEGVKIIEFGKDISEKAEYETNLKVIDGNFYSEEVGDFYIKYSVNSIKFGKIFKIEKVRIVSFVEASEGGE